jgi:hypothetical protein
MGIAVFHGIYSWALPCFTAYIHEHVFMGREGDGKAMGKCCLQFELGQSCVLPVPLKKTFITKPPSHAC